MRCLVGDDVENGSGERRFRGVFQTVGSETTPGFAVDAIEKNAVIFLDLFVRRGKDTTRQTGFRIAQNGGRKHEIYHVFLLRGSREKVICEFTPFFRPGTVANCVDKVGVIGVFGVTSRWWKLIDTVRRIEYKSTICGW